MKRSTRILGNLSFAILLVISLLGAMPVSTVEAAPLTYIVNNFEDTNDGTCDATHCTLREAIWAASANDGADTINFSVNGTILLTSALPQINESLVIDGTGKSIAISGDNKFRIFNIYTGTVLLNNLTIQNGVANPYGGGIFNNGGDLTITNSTFTGNHAGFGGGAIANLNNLTIANSTISGSSAATYGGGVYNEGGMLTILNSTFSDNSAATLSGGGVYNASGATIYLKNTILANSIGGDCANAGTIGSNINNLVEDGSCSTSGVNFKSGDPILDVLADNGGPTQTIKLLSGSPALDTGDDMVCATALVNNLDQRGVTRPSGPGCDIGAYEAVYASSISLNPSPLNFGQQAVGTTSTPRTVTLTYTGMGVINIGALTISGEFAFSGDNTCDHAALPSGGSCTFSVTFSPTTSGTKIGTVTIPSDAFSNPDSLVLTGTGTAPVVGLSARSLAFALTYVDTTSVSKPVTITNTGAATLVIGNIYTSGDFILHTNRCTGARLAAGAKCTFKVAFMPLSSGIHYGRVIIPNNAATSPDKVILRGRTKEGIQLLKMGNFDLVTQPIPWLVSAPDQRLVRIRDCYVFRSPFCSAKFAGSRINPILSAMQLIRRYGAAGDKFYIGLSSRALKVPLGGQYKLIVSFYGNTGLVASKTLLFSSGTHAFQTVGLTYTVPAPYTRILFNFTYQKSGGYAWFDDAMLILLP